MQGKRSHRTLISDVENNAVVGRHTIQQTISVRQLERVLDCSYQISP